MKKHIKTIALTLTTVSVVAHCQEVYGLEREEVPRQAQTPSSSNDDWFDEDTSGDYLGVNKESSTIDPVVTDLFSDTTPPHSEVQGQEEANTAPTKEASEEVSEEPQDRPKSHSEVKTEQDKESHLSDKVDTTAPTWEATDFITKGDTLVGFSKSGVEKLSHTGHLLLPSRAADGTVLTQVASFAFTPDKKTAIAEYTSRVGENGKTSQLDVSQKEIINEGEVFNAYRITKVTIPNGYKHIGSDAFVDNKNISEIILPESLESISDYAFAHMSLKQVRLPNNLTSIGELAFFDNQITGTLYLPSKLTRLAERSFKSNHIQAIEFGGNELKVIGEASFQDNDLTTVTLPDGLEKIESEAFTGNPGDDHYNNYVVLRTKTGQNPHQLSTENVYVNPGKALWQEGHHLDYSKWLEEDFTYQKNVVTGFSAKGLQKVRRNKHLEIPKQYKGIIITEIGDNAFRNVDFYNKTLRKYDLEEVKLPSTIRKIGAFAFQSNSLTSFEASEDLEEIKEGAFMNNRLATLELNDKLTTIGDAAFHINHIYAIVIPESVQKIGRSAFRQNGAKNLIFMGNKVKSLGEMAFLSNALESLDLSEQKQLTEIPVQAFSDNALIEVILPPALQSIREEAFKKNHLKELNASSTLSYIAFNAFDENTGDDHFDKKVVVKTVNNSHDLADGDQFVVDPMKLAKTTTDIADILKRIAHLPYQELRQTTQTQFKEIAAAGRRLQTKKNLSQGEKLKFLQDAQFFLGRLSLDKLLAKAEQTLVSKKGAENSDLLERTVGKARLAYNNSAVTETKLKRLEKELDLLTGLVEGKGSLAHAKMVQGVYLLKTPLPLPEYYIGLNVYFDQAGKIIYVLDMSDTIGEGQKDDYGNPIVNVDEDNEGYHALAIATLADYEGLTIKDILESNLDQLKTIRQVPMATYHRSGIFQALRNAAAEAEQLRPKTDKHKQKSRLTQSATAKNEHSQIYSDPTRLPSSQHLNKAQPSGILPRTGSESNPIYTVLGYLSLALLFLISLGRKGDIKLPRDGRH
ncbi:leucine-rich repeat adhesin HupY/LrrG [Streptococcus pseudoporcinus]|uniref:LPXTG-motif cell wall anchor domain protein n=1 Tax=Streptococcus pseudoporcinus LQ 940-04 TaxID=875093 RepID=G5K9H2_9STRE|nr:leucine-rich repeat protein [Streptococcus pseudoporcinus]EFR43576.1 LPXTG-motif cell wall anchor domain protein [Streptococcus pseudoporcinus SPIN 20026]EHI65293.1 LPXTG-motif cell wall anchor domain protein [Streptococcus pseudoporcinus LQ 940-04]VEF93646.1 Cell surface protein [Streptococcus pseudoporcinus]